VGLLDRLLGRNRVPEWAHFFAPDEYAAFMRAVEEGLRARFAPVSVTDGVAHVSEDVHFGLGNLAQRCRSVPVDCWQEIIDAQFTTLFDALALSTDFERSAADFTRARGLLRMALYPANLIASLPPAAVPLHVEMIEGVLAVVVFDLPTNLRMVDRGFLADWKRGEAEVLRTALRNTRPSEKLVRVETCREGSPELRFFTVESDSLFTASHVLFLEDYLLPADLGALVAAPTRTRFLFRPIRSDADTLVAGPMLEFAMQFAAAGPSPVSPDLFFWQRGKLVPPPIRMTKKGVQTPIALGDMLMRATGRA
jgi:hypothetical protein